jgi:uncharacterized integral membrane protein
VTNPSITPTESDSAHDASTSKGVRHTRISATWTAVAVVVILGVALIAFLAQNTRSVEIKFFGATGHVPVAIALFAAAMIGALIVLGVGVARTAQLRIAARRQASTRSSSTSSHDASASASATTTAPAPPNEERADIPSAEPVTAH